MVISADSKLIPNKMSPDDQQRKNQVMDIMYHNYISRFMRAKSRCLSPPHIIRWGAAGSKASLRPLPTKCQYCLFIAFV